MAQPLTKEKIREIVKGVLEEPLPQIAARNNFYRAGKKGWQKIALALAGGVVLLSMGLLYAVIYGPEDNFFDRAPDGSWVRIHPDYIPQTTDTDVISFAARCVALSHSMDFLNYREKLSSTKKECFTDNGYTSFLAALKNSLTLDTIKKKNLISTAIAQEAPVIIDKGVADNRYYWIVRFPILITYQHAADKQNKREGVTITIVRQSIRENRWGIGIEQLVSVRLGN